MDPHSSRVLIATAALVAVAVTPLAVLGAVADEGTALRSLSFLGQLAVFLGGGALAVRRAPGGPLALAAGAAVLGWAIVQVGAIATAPFRDAGVRWATLPFLALFVATTGMVGGMLALWRGRRDRADWS
jgi:uncharacterized SAM-binding protein YcdF (DUF218 family)